MYLLHSLLFGSVWSSTLFGFGDWGCHWGKPQLDQINACIQQHDEATEATPGVLLLGDNFYPDGINPALGYADPQWRLFTHHLSRDISHIPFFSILGNHDIMRDHSAELQMLYSTVESNWIMPDRNYFQPMGHGACVWFIDTSVGRVTPSTLTWLERSLEQQSRSCKWRIFATHYPAATCGVYHSSKKPPAIRTALRPFILDYGIQLYISGHDHNTQVLTVEDTPGCLFVIVGAVCDINPNSVRAEQCKSGTRLHWSDARHQPVISKIDFAGDRFGIRLGVPQKDGDFETLYRHSW